MLTASKKLLVGPLTAALLATAMVPAADAAGKVRYAGKTAEGTGISFDVQGSWVQNITISAPVSCVSAQGGSPRAKVMMFLPLFKFRLGAQNAKAKEEVGITKNYTLSTRGKAGKAISGKFEVNWSELGGGTSSADMKIIECLGTAKFKVKPKR